MADSKMMSLEPIAARDEEKKEGRERVFEFAPVQLDRRPGKTPANPAGRDWSAALDLIAEASEAVRLSDERTQQALEYNEKITVFYKEQLKTAEAKAAGAERRADAAEARATEAEEWLGRLHDAIVLSFKGIIDR